MPSFGFPGRKAVTMIELLLVLGGIATLTGLGLVVAENVTESTRVTKLENDVAVINSAIQVYRISGGTLPGSPSVQEVLNKLKTQASESSGARLAGFRGSVVDARLRAEMQTSGEAASGRERALWDEGAQRLVIAAGGALGVRRFVLDETLGTASYGAEERSAANPRGTNEWVWEYADTQPTTPGAPEVPGAGAGAGTTSPTAPSPQQLIAPTFDPPGGTHPIFDFNLKVKINNPNSAAVSQIWYNTGSGFAYYRQGQEISIPPGGNLTAYAKAAQDLDRWTDSNTSSAAYQGEPLELQASLSMPAESMTYQEAGGSMQGIATQTPQPATLEITNLDEIPAAYQTSSNFKVVWTYDNSDPLTSQTAQESVDFQNIQMDTSISRWTSEGLNIRAAVKAVNTTFFENSTVQPGTMTIAATQLTRPIIDPPSSARTADLPISIYAGNGSYPTGARIFYTVDGSDPGEGGVPTGGTQYTLPFTTNSADGSGIVNARYYGPANFSHWFTPSLLRTAIYTIGNEGMAVVGGGTISGTYVGSLILTQGTNFIMNGNSSIKAGNLYVRGTPTIIYNGDATVEGRQFLSDGTEILPATDTRKVIDLDGDIQPSNYQIILNGGVKIEGKIYRRVDVFTPPGVAAPPNPSNNNNLTIGSSYPLPVNPGQYANVTLNGNPGDVTLQPGNYGTLNANGGAFVLGTAGSTTPTVYNMQSLNLNAGSQLKIVGPVILTLKNGFTGNGGVIIGNSEHPEWLNLRVSTGGITLNGGSAAYAELNAPTSDVIFQSTFRGSVLARRLTINGNNVVISQAIISDGE